MEAVWSLMSVPGRAPMSWAKPAAAAVALACALAVGGCSADERPPPVPPGFSSYRGNGYVFAYPTGWAVSRKTDEQEHPLVLVDGPEGSPGGLPRGQIRVGREAPAWISFAEQLNQYRAMNLVGGRQVRVDREVKIPGAEVAHRFEAVYSIEVAQDETVRLEVIDLYVLTEDNALLNLAVRAPEGGIAAARLPEALTSFRVNQT
jgi:hypothetical protein